MTNARRLLITVIMLYATVGGCGSSTPESVSISAIQQERENSGGAATEAVQPAAPTAQIATTAAQGNLKNVVGVWTGTSVANCVRSAANRCNAEQKITFTLILDSKLTGFYKCAYGNRTCLHMNETGKVVEATLTESRMTIRVAMPDGTSCLYTGLIASDAVKGGYSCYAGGGLLEQGIWQGQRSY